MRSHLAVFVGAVALAGLTVNVAAQADQHAAGTHTHAEAAAVKNPVKSTPASIEAGKKLYDTSCASCHGATGKGDGKMAASIPDPKPSDLTDKTWKHGSSEGEIFTMIKDGSKGTAMRGYASRMKTEDLWNVVNYLKTLAAK
jgi:mono/diheme cytochrome c family protein